MTSSIKTCELVERVVVTPYFQELNEYLREHSWNLGRGLHIKAQQDTVSIGIRKASKHLVRRGDNYSFHTQLVSPGNDIHHFPLTLAFLKQFAKRKRGILSRAILVKLLPRKKVLAHYDHGEYYAIRDRYHIVLSSKGSEMLTGGVTSTFVTGDLFYFNNHLTHEAYNNSDEDRIHIIFDVLPIGVGTLSKYVWSIIKTIVINFWFKIAALVKKPQKS